MANTAFSLSLSGGYNIKTGPGCSIEIMKTDMGGSAAVLGAAKAIGQIKPLGVEVKQLSCSPPFDVIRILNMLLSFKSLYLYFLVPKQVHFVIAACENMISGTGMRPGDIITASNGKTIEVYLLWLIDLGYTFWIPAFLCQIYSPPHYKY